MKVLVDKPGDYQLGSRQLTDRIGRPLWAAAVQIKKNYVSYHLMPVCLSRVAEGHVAIAQETDAGQGVLQLHDNRRR